MLAHESQLLENICDSLTENLLRAFPNTEASLPSNLTLRWRDECRDYAMQTNLSLSEQQVGDLVDAAFARAVENWKKQVATKLPQNNQQTKAASFSLFANNKLVVQSWKNIDAESKSDTERLDRLSKMTYLDDVLPAWDQIRSFLTTKALQDESLVTTAIQLHIQWFQKCHESTDYIDLQTDLLENIVNRKFQALSRKNNKLVYLSDLIVSFHTMWMDWMRRGCRVDRARRAGHTVWFHLLKPHKQRPGVFLRMLLEIDPHAQWFHAWALHISVQEVLEMTDDDLSILPILVNRCEQEKPDSVVRWHFLCIIRSILTVTRVSMFPWQVLADNDRSQSIEMLIRLFAEQLQEPVMEKRGIACDALEILLLGYQSEATDVCLTAQEHVASISQGIVDLRSWWKSFEQQLAAQHEEIVSSSGANIHRSCQEDSLMA